MEIIFAVIAFLTFFAFMSLGLLIQNKPLKGSCGGVSKLMGNEECDICGGNPNQCEEFNRTEKTEDIKAKPAQADLAYDISKKYR